METQQTKKSTAVKHIVTDPPFAQTLLVVDLGDRPVVPGL
jgi:hypothetical protein